MKAFGLLILVLFIGGTVSAKGKPKRERVQGGIHADSDFSKRWESMVRPQKFPLLPKAKKVPLPDLSKASTKSRQRYVFHLDVNSLKVDDSTWDGKYYNFVYNNKEQGLFLLLILPKYRECFDNLKKKFDQMQWVVYVWSEWDMTEEGLGKIKQLALEYPRQCLGALKYTGSKLKDAKGEVGK